MTINDLLKQFPNEEDRNKIIIIYIPQLREGDEGDYPLIEVNKMNDQIYLEADTN
jgi:hypothetical protein